MNVYTVEEIENEDDVKTIYIQLKHHTTED